MVCNADGAIEGAELLGEDALVDEVVFDDEDVEGLRDGFCEGFGVLWAGFLREGEGFGVGVGAGRKGLLGVCG